VTKIGPILDSCSDFAHVEDIDREVLGKAKRPFKTSAVLHSSWRRLASLIAFRPLNSRHPYWIMGRFSPILLEEKGPNSGIAEISERGRHFPERIVFGSGKDNSKSDPRLSLAIYFNLGRNLDDG